MTLMELMALVRRKWYLVVILPILFAAAAGGFAYGFMTDDFTSSVSLYVLSKTDDSAKTTATSSDMTASQQMANDIAVMAKSDRVKFATAEALGMESLSGYTVGVSSATTNRVITLSVTGKKPESVALIADELAEQTSIVAKEAMDLKSVYTVQEAVVATSPSGPNRPMYIAVAFMAGLFVAIALIVLIDMLDGTIRNSDESEELLGVPVLGRMPYVKSLKG